MKIRKSVLALAIVSGILLIASIACAIVGIILTSDFATGFKSLIDSFVANITNANGDVKALIATVGCLSVALIITIIWVVVDALRKKGIVALFAIMTILAGGVAALLIPGVLVTPELSNTASIIGFSGIICGLVAFAMVVVLFIVDLATGKEKKDAMQIAEDAAKKNQKEEIIYDDEPVEEAKTEEVSEEPAAEPVEEEKPEAEVKKEEPAPVEEKKEEPKVEAAKAEKPVVEKQPKEQFKKAEKPAKEEKKPAAKAEKKETAKKSEPKKAEEKKAEPKAKEVKKEEKPAASKAKEEKKPAPVKEEPKKAEAPAKEEKKEKDGPTKVYHVSKRATDEKWVIKFAGGEKVIKTFRTKVEACEYADKLAASQGGIVLVHASKGKNAGRINEKR